MFDVWSPSSWQARPALQQPAWPDAARLDEVLERLSALPPLVFAGETRRLGADLARVARGEALLLQAGDCSESFHTSVNSIRDKLRVFLQMSAVLAYSTGVPVVKVGRMAGQYAKPRSSSTEMVDGVELPTFRGEMVNSPAPTPEARRADPGRLLEGYQHAASTLNLLRAFTAGGYADLEHLDRWNLIPPSRVETLRQYRDLVGDIEAALRFMHACGVDVSTLPAFSRAEFYTSHEALLLPYEEALTRQDSITGDWYACSAHMLWVGERTRQLDGAHLEFLRGVGNPVGVKVGPLALPEEVARICELLDPDRVSGRVTIISRMGAPLVAERLGPVISAVRAGGHLPVWACDPMHGNTVTSSTGHKTRRFTDVAAEVEGFVGVCRRSGVWPGGLHLELTGDDVTECTGGVEELADADLPLRYETTCDPRLNASQSVELAFAAGRLWKHA